MTKVTIYSEGDVEDLRTTREKLRKSGFETGEAKKSGRTQDFEIRDAETEKPTGIWRTRRTEG